MEKKMRAGICPTELNITPLIAAAKIILPPYLISCNLLCDSCCT